MNDEKRNIARQRLQNSKAYQRLETIQKVLDQYCLDGFMGLIPYGIGDVISALFSVAYAWFALTKIKSTPLTLAIIYNTLRDVLLGLIPFYIGDIIDFFHRSNRQNMQLVRGFVEGDIATIKEVNRQAVSLSILIIIFLILIFALAYLAVVTAQWIFNLFAN